jgi:hypothetical protein
MIATKVIGNGYVSCVVVHISKAPRTTRLSRGRNLLGKTVEFIPWDD